MRGNLATAPIRDDHQDPVISDTNQTLEDFLKFWAQRAPNALAFADAPNRTDFAIGDPKRITFAEAYEISGIMAAQFRAHGLYPGHILAIQLPNVVELPIIVLAALRAGLIACPFPFLWRAHEINQAFQMIPARALITVGGFDGYPYSEMMCQLAFEHLSVRFVYGIGPHQADGVTSLDTFFAPDWQKNKNTLRPQDEPGEENLPYKANLNDPALITWSVKPGLGLRPIFRSHRELITSGLMHVLELGLNPADRILNPYPLTGLIGLSGMFMPSLLVGASVVQHHPFNYDAFIKQMASEKATYAAAPAPVLHALLQDRILQSRQNHNLQRFGCVWQVPHEKLPPAPFGLNASLPIYDIRNLHETAVYISKRTNETEQGDIKLGEIVSTDPSGQRMRLLETRFKGRLRQSNTGDTPTYTGMLYVRGLSVPKGSGVPEQIKTAEDVHEDWVNTGIRCSIAQNATRMDRVVCEPNPTVIYHGGAMLFAHELDEIYSSYEFFKEAAVFTQPDPILGERIFAAVVPQDGVEIAKDQFGAYLESLNIAPYKIPEKLVIVQSLPKNEYGQVLRHKILDHNSKA